MHVEPDRLAGIAEIDRDLAADVAVERLVLHRLVAARTIHIEILSVLSGLGVSPPFSPCWRDN